MQKLFLLAAVMALTACGGGSDDSVTTTPPPSVTTTTTPPPPPPVTVSAGPTVSTLAGNGTVGFVDGAGAAAKFYSPYGVAVDSNGNVFTADLHTIRKITPAGDVSIFAGSTVGFVNGVGTTAKFSSPLGIAVDSSGTVYVADSANQAIRKITPAGVVSTLAGTGASGFVNGTGTAASFSDVADVAVDGSGNVFADLELDDADEMIGAEDEENNYYSIAGDNYKELEEDHYD